MHGEKIRHTKSGLVKAPGMVANGSENRNADDIVTAVLAALEQGAHHEARELAVQGGKQYPAHESLKKLARLLAPPKTLRRVPADPAITENQHWLRPNADRYQGQWVALRNGQILAAAPTLGELKQQAELSPDTFVTRVL